MNKKNIERIRNIGIIAHIDAGKTTVTERILYYTGKSHKIGEVHDGEAIMDWMADEQERGITITSAVTSCFWGKNHIQIIDTPGHVDFTIEVERSLRILDGAIGVFCAVGGVEPQSETVWLQADKHHIPKIAFINKLDRVGSNFFNVIKMIKKRLKVQPLILQIPVGQESNFKGVVDLIGMTQIEWDKDSFGVKYIKKKIDPEIYNTAKEYREKLIEILAEHNDDIMEAYVSDIEVDENLLSIAIRRATIELKLVPILCGSALKNKGIQPLLDAVVNFLPSPIDIFYHDKIINHNAEKETRFTPKESETLAALIFKVSIIDGRKLSFVRVYSGKIKAGLEVYNPIKCIKEKVSRILVMHANRRERISEAGPGSIVGIVGLKHSETGETLCDEKQQLILEKIYPQEPVISLAIEPKTRSDQEKLENVLSKFSIEDPTLKIDENKDTGQTVLSGMGELHLEVVISRMRREFKTNVNVGKPQVVYRETILKSSKSRAIFDKEIVGQQHYAEVTLELSPLGRGQVNVFESKISDPSIPEEVLNIIKQSAMESLETGIIMGYPVVDVMVRVLEVSVPDSRGKYLAYKAATAIACRKALETSDTCLLSPIMNIEITVPEEFVGEVISDLNGRKGKIISINTRNGIQIINATVPLSKTFGYSTSLRSVSQGRGVFSMKFSKFDIID